MEDLTMYAVYAAYDAVVLVPLGALMWLAVRRCNRVCQGRRWPRRVAMVVAAGFLFVALLPFLKFGTDWVGTWWFLNAPFSVVLEFNASIGFWFYNLLSLVVTTAFWSTLGYVVAAVVVRVTRKSESKVHERGTTG